jgi:hypothetical protein
MCRVSDVKKGTKNAMEMGRTFSTILADIDFRQKLLEAHSEEEFKQLILKQTHQLADEQSEAEKRCSDNNSDAQDYEYVSLLHSYDGHV